MHITPPGTPTSLQTVLVILYSSSQLDTLNDLDTHTLLHHSSGSGSSPDVSMVPAHLAPSCEWRTLPGLGSNISLSTSLYNFLPSATTTLEPQPSISKRPIGMNSKNLSLITLPSYRGSGVGCER